MIEDLISRVFADRDEAHLRHWQTTSYAEHMALGAFYLGAIELIDAVAEEYQGLFGKIGEIKRQDPREDDDIKSCLRETADWIESNRDELAYDSSSLGNTLDTVTALYSRTIYLLSLQ